MYSRLRKVEVRGRGKENRRGESRYREKGEGDRTDSCRVDGAA